MGICSKCQTPLAGGAAICDACLLDETLHASAVPGNEDFGRYEVLCEIGEGGLAVVYLAQQTAPIRREVALKAWKAGAGGRDSLARFETERPTLALFDPPDIARVYDAGSSSAGRPFLVMEYVEGQPITQYCDEHGI